jgi:hypothetical protein
LSEERFFAGDDGVGLVGAAAGISGFDRIRLVLVNLGLVWLVGNLVWGLMVMSVLLFIR